MPTLRVFARAAVKAARRWQRNDTWCRTQHGHLAMHQDVYGYTQTRRSVTAALTLNHVLGQRVRQLDDLEQCVGDHLQRGDAGGERQQEHVEPRGEETYPPADKQ